MTLLPDSIPEPFRSEMMQAEDRLKQHDPAAATALCTGVLRTLAGDAGNGGLGDWIAGLADELHGPGGWPQPAVELQRAAAHPDPAHPRLPPAVFAENLVNFTLAALNKRYAAPGQPPLAVPNTTDRDDRLP